MAKNTDYCRGTGFQFSGSSFCYFFAVFVFVYTLSFPFRLGSASYDQGGNVAYSHKSVYTGKKKKKITDQEHYFKVKSLPVCLYT